MVGNSLNEMFIVTVRIFFFFLYKQFRSPTQSVIQEPFSAVCVVPALTCCFWVA